MFLKDVLFFAVVLAVAVQRSDTKKIPLIAKDSILSLSLHKYNRVDRSIAAVMAKGQPVCNACRFHTIFAFSTNMCEKIFPTIQKDVELKYNMVTTDSITSGETANIVQIYTFSWLKNFLIIEINKVMEEKPTTIQLDTSPLSSARAKKCTVIKWMKTNKKKDGPLAIDSKETLEKEDVQAIEKDGMIYTTLPKKQFMNVIKDYGALLYSNHQLLGISTGAESKHPSRYPLTFLSVSENSYSIIESLSGLVKDAISSKKLKPAN